MTFTTRVLRRIVCAPTIALAVIGVPAAAIAAAPANHPGSAVLSLARASTIPKGFSANAITWKSAKLGWVLGGESCGKLTNCATSQVLATTDGGASWKVIGSIHAPIPKLPTGRTGVTEIRFASAKVGWAFSPGLFRTADGGRTWTSTPIPGHGKQVLDLAVTSTSAYAIVSPCGHLDGLCNGKEPLTAWRTNLARTSWTKMPVRLHINVSANVAAYGKTVYIVNPMVKQGLTTQFYASTNAGRRFSARRDPCTSAEENTLIQAAPYSATKVALLCDGNPGFSKAVKAVYRSVNTGRTDAYAGTMGLYGIQAELTVSPSGDLATESWSDGSFIYINDTRGTTWQMIIGSGDGGAGFNDITYVNNKTAWVVYSPDDLFPAIGVLYVTHDAGLHWSLAKF